MKHSTTTINPYTQEPIATYEYLHESHIPTICNNVTHAGQSWKNTSITNRALYLKTIAQVIRQDIEKYALTATQEMGKPLAQSIAELEKCAVALDYYATEGPQLMQAQNIDTQHQYSAIHFEPIGTVLAVMPWNFPYWQVFRVMGPILIGGNTMILKHASQVSGCALHIAEIVEKAGLPEHVFQTVICASSDVEYFIANPAVQAVTFTGSTEVGRNIAQTAGKYLKKQVLELGGSDAYIVCADADLVMAAKALVQSRLNNTGQSCIGAKRFIVLKEVWDDFLDIVSLEMDAYPFGDPLDDQYKLGPLCNLAARDELHQQVLAAVNNGAVLLKGGYLPESVGAFYPPTILASVQKENPAYTQEFFGPVAMMLQAQTLEEAIHIANDSPFGLGGGIFSNNESKALTIATHELLAGSVSINACVSSDPRMPFGGIKESGYGRELHQFGIFEFVNIKSVVQHNIQQ